MISIIIPTIREQKAQRCIEAIYKNAGIDQSKYEIISEYDHGRIGCPKMVKKLTDESSGDMVCFLGDDTIPEPNFLKYALEDMAKLSHGWGLVGINDNLRLKGQDKASAHWLADKQLLPLLDNEFFHTGYIHCFCDNELTDRCKELGRYIFSECSRVYHDHPIDNKRSDDKDYQRVYNRRNYNHDLLLYKKRKRNNWKTK